MIIIEIIVISSIAIISITTYGILNFNCFNLKNNNENKDNTNDDNTSVLTDDTTCHCYQFVDIDYDGEIFILPFTCIYCNDKLNDNEKKYINTI
jgi:hypothetical protein